MSFSIYAWTENKKRAQSTKLPPSTKVELTNVVLKNETSIYSPIFIINSKQDYVYIQWGDKFYWVDDIVHLTNDNNLYMCSLDYYSTFRTFLGSGSYPMVRQYIDDMTNKYSFSSLQDDFITMEQNASYVSSSIDFLNRSNYLVSGRSWSYAIQITTGKLTDYGLETIIVSYDNFATLVNTLYNSPVSMWNGVDDSTLPENFEKTYIDPAQFIKTVRMYPIPYNTLINLSKSIGGGTTYEEKFYIGWTSIGVIGFKAPNIYMASDLQKVSPSQALVFTGSFLLPIVEGNNSDGSDLPFFTFNSRYMNITVHTGIWGDITIPPEMIYTPASSGQQKCEAGPINNTLYYAVYVDFFSGLSTLMLSPEKLVGTLSNYTVSYRGGPIQVTASLGVDIPLHQVISSHSLYSAVSSDAWNGNQGTVQNTLANMNNQPDTSSVSTTIENMGNQLQTVGNSLSSLLAGISSTGKVYQSLGANNNVQVTNISSSGGFFPIGKMSVNIRYYKPINHPKDYNDIMGRPVCGVLPIVEGFNQMKVTDVNLSATGIERKALLQIMLNGYYYE